MNLDFASPGGFLGLAIQESVSTKNHKSRELDLCVVFSWIQLLECWEVFSAKENPWSRANDSRGRLTRRVSARMQPKQLAF